MNRSIQNSFFFVIKKSNQFTVIISHSSYEIRGFFPHITNYSLNLTIKHKKFDFRVDFYFIQNILISFCAYLTNFEGDQIIGIMKFIAGQSRMTWSGVDFFSGVNRI